MPSGFQDNRGRDMVIRTILGEAGSEGPEGWRAVAHVIKNRIDSGVWGDTITGTIKYPEAFTLWNAGNKVGSYANSVSPDDEVYKQVGRLVDGVFTHQISDNTGGANHYYAPSGMPGGRPPEWAIGQNGQRIGTQIFYKLPLTASEVTGTPAAPAGGAPAAPPLAALGAAEPQAANVIGNALASARTMLGKNEVPDRSEIISYLHNGGQDLDPHKVAWCAAFVSATLQKAGLPVPTQVVKGSAFGPGAYAPNYLTYGNAVDDPKAVQAGDIVVAKNGSHVGFAEGPVRMGPNGPEVQLLAGNEKDTSGQYAPGSYTSPTGETAGRSQVGMVGERWVPLSQYSIRRYQPPAAAANAQTPAPAGQGGIGSDATIPLGTAPTVMASAARPQQDQGQVQLPSSETGGGKFSVLQGMTSGGASGGRNPMLYTAANWGGGDDGGKIEPPILPPSPAPAPVTPPTPPEKPTSLMDPPIPPVGASIGGTPALDQPDLSPTNPWGGMTPAWATPPKPPQTSSMNPLQGLLQSLFG